MPVSPAALFGPVVDRVAVGLGHGPDQHPAGVGVDRVELGREGEDCMQQEIGRDGAAQEPDVVPQAADFNRHFVGERDDDPSAWRWAAIPWFRRAQQGGGRSPPADGLRSVRR